MRINIGARTKKILRQKGVYDRFLKELENLENTEKIENALERCNPRLVKEYEVILRDTPNDFYKGTVLLRKRKEDKNQE